MISPIYNLDFINSERCCLTFTGETGDQRYKAANDILIKQLKNQPRTLEGGFCINWFISTDVAGRASYMASPFMAQYGAGIQ